MKKHLPFFVLIAFLTIPFANFGYTQTKCLDSSKQIICSLQIPSEQNSLDKWIIPITKVATLLTIIIGIFVSVWQLYLKTQAEIRLKESAQAEIDVKLLNLFTEIMDVAHSRKGHIVSEKLIEELFKQKVFSTEDFQNLGALNKKVEIASNIPLNVGVAAQEAAIVAIGKLGMKYDILKDVAIQGLESLKTQGIGKQTDNYLELLKG